MPDFLDVSDVTPRITYVATASQTVFVIPFAFEDNDHIQVFKNDVQLTYVTHYALTGEDEEDGGTVVLVTGASLSDVIVIIRDVPVELTTHISPSGPLDIAAINEQFTLLVMMLQQVVADRVRSIKQPSSDVTDLNDLPVAASRANKYLFFDSSGQPSLVSSVTAAAAASAFMLTLLDDTTAAAARSTLGVTDQSAYSGLSNFRFCR